MGGVQKEINNLNGKMERTYIEITMNSRINNKEPYIEQGLDLTCKIHQECNEITEIIRKTGAVSREIRDIESQIRQDESRDLKSKVERLSIDLQMLQKENSEI